MATALTILIAFLSAGILAGRIYEITALTDPQTGFFLYKGIVLNPNILVMFVVITICCAIVIFGTEKTVKPFFSHSSKLIAAAAGAMLVVYGVMSLKSGITSIAVIAGGIAFLIMGTTALKAKFSIKDTVVTVLFVFFIAGLCLDVIIIDVATIYNAEFVKNALSYIAAALLIMFVMKNVFSPTPYSRMLLYISGVTAFVFCGIMHVADIAAMAISDNIVLPDLFLHAGFGFIGFFGLDNAVSVIPGKKSKETEEVQAKPQSERIPVQRDTQVLTAEAETARTAEIPQPKQENSYTAFAQSIYAKTSETAETAVNKTTVSERENSAGSRQKFRAESAAAATRKGSAKTVYKKPK